MPRNEVLSIVNATPEIEWVVDATWLGHVVDWAMAFAVSYCNLPCYPELLHGRTVGRANAQVDLTDLTSGAFLVSVDGGAFHAATVTPASCADGAATAAALQTAIRVAIVKGVQGWDSLSRATVAYDAASGSYIAQSGTYGRGSRIRFSYELGASDVMAATGLAPSFGVVEVEGANGSTAFDQAVAQLAVRAVIASRLDQEIADGGDAAMKKAFDTLDPMTQRVFQRFRRMRVI